MGQWKTIHGSGLPLFAAANSGHGFVSFYEDVFGRREILKRYIIKGGPGTGKSHLMRRVADAAEKHGRAVARYCCSSDPESLDGIVIDGKIAVLDGTPPHSIEPELPGARDEIVNLGSFWDAAKLSKHAGEIAELSQKKSVGYRRAYRFLDACDQLYQINRSLILPCVKHEKLEKVVERRLSEIPQGKGFSLLPGLSDGVGMKGSVHFDTYEHLGKKRYIIDDCYDTGALFLRALLTGGGHRACQMRVSYHPIHIGEPNAVFFEDGEICFVIANERLAARDEGARINMKRFLDTEGIRAVREKLRMNRRLYDALLASAEESLTEVGEQHFAMERIYASCMDFEAEERFIRSFCERIL